MDQRRPQNKRQVGVSRVRASPVVLCIMALPSAPQALTNLLCVHGTGYPKL